MANFPKIMKPAFVCIIKENRYRLGLYAAIFPQSGLGSVCPETTGSFLGNHNRASWVALKQELQALCSVFTGTHLQLSGVRK